MEKFALHTITRTIALSVLAATAWVVHAAPTTLTFEQFSSTKLPANWDMGAQDGGSLSISTQTGENYAGSAGSIKGSYPQASGGVYVWSVYDVSALATRDLYIEFWAKMPKAKQGLKFLKIFGGHAGGSSSNYANTTFGLDYTGVDRGCMYQVAFGDGSHTANDIANVINFDGQDLNMIGRSTGTATVLTPQKSRWASSNWGTGWHHFKFHVKFNSGTSPATEVADGAYYVEIDGKVYVDAEGLFNRHYSNLPIERVELFGWAQGGTAPFEIWYDDVRITTGGFYSDTISPPRAPAGFAVR